MTTTRRLWWSLGTLLVFGFGILLWMGGEIHRQAPPMPEAVVSETGNMIYTRSDIERGRQVWQSIGGQQLGSIWGHGALVAPDWSADWLHRESIAWLDLLAQRKSGLPYDKLSANEQAHLQTDLRPLIRKNTFDPSANQIVISADRAEAMVKVSQHYESLFSNDPATQKLRAGYAMRENTIPDAQHRKAIAAFFFWTSWATVTERPGLPMSYTQNWPY